MSQRAEKKDEEKDTLIDDNDGRQLEMRNMSKQQHLQDNHENMNSNDITSEVINDGRQMLILWLFIIVQTACIIIKYGPLVDPSQCAILSLDFGKHCTGWIYWIYPAQCTSYVIVFGLFLCCSFGEVKLSNIISQHLCKCDKLAFPFFILCVMVVVEFFCIFLNLFESKKSKFWYFFQICIDFFGYILWMSYASVAGTICSRSNTIQIKHKMLLWHIMFICIAVFDIMWLISAMFGQDFVFDPQHLYLGAFAQIILESTLVLELIHVIMENCIGQHDDDGVVELRISDSENVHTLRRGLIGRKCWIFIFIFPILAQLIISAMKYLSHYTSCSNFNLWIENNECPGWWFWAVQLGLYLVAFLSLMVMFCTMEPLQFKLLEFKRLYFPLCIGLIMIFVQIVYVYAVNPYYLLQVALDFFAYLIIFMQSLYVVQFRKYAYGNYTTVPRGCKGCCVVWGDLLTSKKNFTDEQHYELYSFHDLRIGSCPNWKLMLIILEMVLFFLVILECMVANIVTDIEVQDVAKSLHENHKKNENIVEVIAFIQIVLENTLCMEYLHIVLG